MLPGTPRTFIGSTTFVVRGLTGSATERLLVEVIKGIPGVGSVTIDVAGQTATVTAVEPVDQADIATAVARSGFVLVP